MRHHFIHPYMPNSVPHIEEEMLRELGLSSVEERRSKWGNFFLRREETRKK